MEQFQQALQTYLPQIDTEMRRLMTPPDGRLNPLFGMMHYHLGWVDQQFTPVAADAGKRLRPALTLVACQTLGGRIERALPAAAAVELIHNFTLIHDDIEDRSATRRGRPTVWHIWGEPQGINAGDALFVLARNALLRLSEQAVPAEVVLAAVQKLDETCLALCQGQYLDMHFETTFEVDLAAYLQMIDGKTAGLLACSGYLGALLATDSPEQAHLFWDLGRAMGLAFQIQDDWLGIWGDASATGKPAADDLRRRKKSLPVVFALNHDSPAAAEFRQLYAAEALSEADIRRAITLLETVGSQDFTLAEARRQTEQALSLLAAIPVSAAEKALLQQMADFFIQRTS